MERAVKVFTASLWGAVILLFTITSSLEALLYQREFSFQFSNNFPYRDFLDIPTTIHSEYFRRKVGHAFCFFIFALMSLTLWEWRRVLTIGFGFALLTEVLQIFFSRDGRLLDVGWDFVGVMDAILICKIMSSLFSI